MRHFCSVGSEAFKAWRRERKLTQAAVAVLLDVSSGLIGHWENGTRRPSLDNLAVIVEVTGIAVEAWLAPRVESEAA